MDSTTKLYMERAENELALARIVFVLTDQPAIQKTVFHLDKTQTFYSAVITHSYYCIFYAAKAYLITKGIKTSAPEEHRKVYEAFKELVQNGTVGKELLEHYETVMSQAETLLGILKKEKRKRGDFTYQLISQANKEPAQQSTKHADIFFKHLYTISE